MTGTRHILNDDRGLAGKEARKVPRDNSARGICAAAGGIADDHSDRFAAPE
jgi:hypothetical protein